MKVHDRRRTWAALAVVVALLAAACSGPDPTDTQQAALDQQVQEDRSSTTPQQPVESGQDGTTSTDTSTEVETASPQAGDSEINYGQPGQPFSLEWPILVPLQLDATEYTPELCNAIENFNTLYRADIETNTLNFNGRTDAVIAAAENVASLDTPGAEIASFFDALASMFREGVALSAELREDTENWDDLDRRRLKFEQGSVYLHDQVGIGGRVMLRCGLRLHDGIKENQYPNLRPLLPAPAVSYPIVQQGAINDLEFASIRAEVSCGRPLEVDRAQGRENTTFDASAEATLYIYFDVRPKDELYSRLGADHFALVLPDGGRISAGPINISDSAFSALDPGEWRSGIASVVMQFAPLDNARVRRPDLTGAVIEITRGEDVLRLPLDG